MHEREWFGFVCSAALVGIIATCISGQIGYERGDSYSRWEAHYDAERTKETMESIGVCEWAQLVAHCKMVGDHPPKWDGPISKHYYDKLNNKPCVLPKHPKRGEWYTC